MVTRPDLASPPAPAVPAWSESLRTVVRRSLLDHRRTALAWSVCFGAYGALMAAIYPSIRSSIEAVAKHYPSGLKTAFGVQSMSTVEGYLHAELFSLIVPMAMGYFMVAAVAGATVEAEERGYLDAILSLPISRAVLIAGSYLAGAILCGLVMGVGAVLIFSSAQVAGTGISPRLLIAGVLGVWSLALFAGGLSALAAGVLHRSRVAKGIVLGALIAMYGLDLAGRLVTVLEPVRWFSAFHYYGAPMRDGFHVASLVGLSAAGLLLLSAGAILLGRRDILH